jgi:hypothetical protein
MNEVVLFLLGVMIGIPIGRLSVYGAARLFR